ncbi:hypothetical protein [Acuticoccus sp.]|uniref:hypothetical protein n=1 Tax=Acuticoccus sp. TaxID=1904378 RepID=UPI003B51F7FD
MLRAILIAAAAGSLAVVSAAAQTTPRDPVPSTAVNEAENTIDTPGDVQETVDETDTDRLQPQAGTDTTLDVPVVGTGIGTGLGTGAAASTPLDRDENTIDTPGDVQEIVEETDTDRLQPQTPAAQ